MGTRNLVLALAGAVSLQSAVLSTFQAGAGGWLLGTLGVGDITGGADLEIVVPYRDQLGRWKLDAFDWRGARVSGFPYDGLSNPINVSPTLRDIDGDGKAEIFFTAGALIVALRGNGTLLWSRSVSSGNYVPDSGFMAMTNGFYMSPLGLFQSRLPATAQFFSEVSSPVIADLAGNGTLELLTAWKIKPDSLLGQQDFNPVINDLYGQQEWGLVGETWSGGVIGVNARTGGGTLTYHFHQLVEAGIGLAQLDEDPAIEALVLNDADSVAAIDRAKEHGLHGKGMLHKMFGKNQRLLSGSYLRGVDVFAADIDGDGRDEALVASSQVDPNWPPSETILDDDGAILWRRWLDATTLPTVHGWFNNAAMIPVNPDRDSQVDVLSFTHSTRISFRTWNGSELIDRPGWPKDFAPRLPTPPVVGDVDGDGAEEIIIGSYDPASNPSNGNLHIFSLDGTQKMIISVPGGLKHIPSLADVNRDGSLDVIYRALDGKVYVQNFGAAANARVSWATHRGNAQRDGNFGVNLYQTGSPVVYSRSGGFGSYELNWRAAPGAQGYRVYNGNILLADLPAESLSYRHSGGGFGEQKVFRVSAIGGADSAPIAITSLLNGNLIANGGFEEDDNSHWDKWFSGDIPWERMSISEANPASGRRSMEIKLLSDGSQSSITQYSHYGVPESYLKVSAGKLYSFGGFIRVGGISSSNEHWFEWDSSKTGENTNARPALPWPSYFTPALKAGANSATSWKFLNRVFEMPSGFPNVQLRHRFRIDGRGSGSVFLDNVFFRALPASWTEVIPFGSEWQYSTNAPPGPWTTAAPVNWPTARAKFGAGSGPSGVRTPLPSSKPAYFFRKPFVFPESGVSELLLAATCTDDYGGTVYPMRLFLNGAEIETGPIEAVSGEGNVVKYFDLTPFAGRFSPGTNYLGVMIANTWQPDWDNVAFDVSLRVVLAGGPRFVSVTRDAEGSVSLAMEAPSGTTWTLESSETLVSWSFLREVGFATPTQTVTLPTPGSDRQFYRLTSP